MKSNLKALQNLEQPVQVRFLTSFRTHNLKVLLKPEQPVELRTRLQVKNLQNFISATNSLLLRVLPRANRWVPFRRSDPPSSLNLELKNKVIHLRLWRHPNRYELIDKHKTL